MDSKTKGEKTEAIVLAELVKRDVTVLEPFGENHRYDFVISVADEFYRLQCKAGRGEGGTTTFETRSTRPRGTGISRENYEGDIDFFIVYAWETGDIYLVPVEDAPKGGMVLRSIPTANNQTEGINWAEEYRLDGQLSLLRGT